MRVAKWIVGAGLVVVSACAIPCFGQIAPSAASAQSEGVLNSGGIISDWNPAILTRDGGATTRLTSISVPPTAGAPFTLTLETEWVKPMSNGGTQTLVNRRRIARDSMGRVYQERWILVPKFNSPQASRMNEIQIFDPNEHVRYDCMTLQTPKTCYENFYAGSTTANYKPASVRSGPLPNDIGIAQHEDLGTQMIGDQLTNGTRDTITYNAGVVDSDRAMTLIDERWYSEPLTLSLLSIREDPRFGKQTFKVAKINASEPDARLFELPAGYRVVDRREAQ